MQTDVKVNGLNRIIKMCLQRDMFIHQRDLPNNFAKYLNQKLLLMDERIYRSHGPTTSPVCCTTAPRCHLLKTEITQQYLTQSKISENIQQEIWTYINTDCSAISEVKDGGAIIYISYAVGRTQTAMDCINYPADVEVMMRAKCIVESQEDLSMWRSLQMHTATWGPTAMQQTCTPVKQNLHENV